MKRNRKRAYKKKHTHTHTSLYNKLNMSKKKKHDINQGYKQKKEMVFSLWPAGPGPSPFLQICPSFSSVSFSSSWPLCLPFLCKPEQRTYRNKHSDSSKQNLTFLITRQKHTLYHQTPLQRSPVTVIK